MAWMMGASARMREAGRRAPDADNDVVIVVVVDEILCRFIQRTPSVAKIQCTSHSTFARGCKLFDADAADVTPKRQRLRISLIDASRRCRRQKLLQGWCAGN
ncbi:hypothetical protein Y032_0666g1330 [Ancylostoma ceylanicum]|uniref:Uncharacterized protein n=1 Tax=Ancylostoma ceylanicum TaxID=53326 RepID=A0A016WIX5_9BILA|nr:hypothetical protein Y032_0666g1330 [Ancylostoma ceylanicum]